MPFIHIMHVPLLRGILPHGDTNLATNNDLSPFNAHFPGGPGLASTRISLFCIGAKDDGGGGDNWSYKSCKAPVKSSPPTNQHPAFYMLDAIPVAKPTVSELLLLLLIIIITFIIARAMAIRCFCPPALQITYKLLSTTRTLKFNSC